MLVDNRYLPVPGRPTTLAYGRAGPVVLAAGAGRVGYVIYFCLISSTLSSFLF